MSKFKKIILAALLACSAVCLSLAAVGCSNKDKFPDFREPEGYTPELPADGEEYNGKYIIKVQSVGGRSLNNVTVTAKSNGTEVISGISKNGVIEFAISKGTYELVVDGETLPAGYYVPDDANFRTVADKANATISLPSAVISQSATSSTRYALGDVIHDFGFTDSDGARYTLTDLFKTKNTVVLNFFYTTCVPCQTEFPAIENAYNAYKDRLAIVALDIQDSANEISKFKSDYGLTFHMGYDSAGITNLFGVTAFPTTVVVDRYGVIEYVSSGTQPNESVWRALFNRFTSDNYEQSNDNGNDQPLPTERVKPTEGLVMPSHEELAAAALGTGANGKVTDFRPETGESDAPYSWPWVVKEEGGRSFIAASNSKGGYSFAILYSTVHLESGEVLSYEYNVDTEAEHDMLYALIDGQIVGTHSGNSSGWKEAQAVFVADRSITLTLSFIYIKDQLKDEGEDTAFIDNISIRHLSELNLPSYDQKVTLTDGMELKDGKYISNGINFTEGDLHLNNSDGYYYVSYKDANGVTRESILLMSILKATVWADKHMGRSNFINEEGNSQPASMYHMSFWMMSNHDRADKEIPLKFDYGDSEQLIQDYYLEEFSDNKLLPVTEKRKNNLIAFINHVRENYSSVLKDGDTGYEDEWLEYCFIYKHYGLTEGNGSVCYEKHDPIKGLIKENAFIAQEGKNHANVSKMINLGNGGGVMNKFVPSRTGVYHIYSVYSKQGVDPMLYVHDANGNVIASNNTNVKYDTLRNSSDDNFYCYCVLERGKTYYLQTTMQYALATGEYDFYIEYAGTSFNHLRVASTAEGLWTYSEDPYFEYYLAIDTVLDEDGYYHHYTNDKEIGSVVYVDFLNPNYFDRNGNSLLAIINNKTFDFTSKGGANYTAAMLSYYYRSIEGKDSSDELYGKIEADSTLVNMLNELIKYTTGDGHRAKAWLMFCCYYEYYSVDNL